MIGNLGASACVILVTFLAWAAPLCAETSQTRRLQTADSLLQFEETLQEVVRRVAPAVVTFRWSGDQNLSASGVVFDESGLILTYGHHNKKPWEDLDVLFSDGRVVPAKLISVYRTTGADWSLVQIQRPGKWPAAPLHRGESPKVNDWCFHLGYPSPVRLRQVVGPLSLRLGQVVALGHSLVYAHCLTASGDSGGPLFDLNGRVIGVAKGAIASGDDSAAGIWVRVPALATQEVLLTASDLFKERERLGLVGENRRRLDKNRGIPTRPFRDVLEPVRQATVEVILNDQPVALGLIVHLDGMILTKRAEILTRCGELAGKLSCRLCDSTMLTARPMADSYEHDLALLRVDRQELPTVPWSQAETVKQGCLVAAVGLDEEPLAVGVVGTDGTFAVEPDLGQTGFNVLPDSGGVRVTDIQGAPMDTQSGAWPQIRGGELITHVNGKPTLDLAAFERVFQEERTIAGDLIRMTMFQNGQTRDVVFPMVPGYGGRFFLDAHETFSWRRTGFPAVFGHDAVLTRRQCGGPLIDVRGRVIGVNIARDFSHQTLAIPCTVVWPLVEAMATASRHKVDGSSAESAP